MTRVRRQHIMLAATLMVAVTATACATNPAEMRRSDTYGADITTLVIELDNPDVRIVGSDRNDIQVDRTLRYSGGDEPEEHIDHRGSNTLAITARCPSGFIQIAECGGTYEIQVPHGTRIQVADGIGRITVEDTRGDAALQSDDGTVDVMGSVTTVEATAGVGAIRMDLTSAARIEAHSNDGAVMIAASGPIETLNASTGVGDIAITVPTSGTRYAVDASTGTGTTTVGVPEGPGGIPVRATSDDGDIAIRPGAVG